MTETLQSITDYLQNEVTIQTQALKPYDTSPIDDNSREPEIKSFRKIQAMIIRDRISELNRHLAVIKIIYDNAKE